MSLCCHGAFAQIKKITTFSQIRDLVSMTFSVVLNKIDQTIWVFGDNTHGQLGFVSSSQNIATPTKVQRGDEFEHASDVACGDKFTVLIDSKNKKTH